MWFGVWKIRKLSCLTLMLCRGRKRDVQRFITQIHSNCFVRQRFSSVSVALQRKAKKCIKDLKRMRTTIVLLIFDWWRCRCRRIVNPVSVFVCREDSRMRMLFLQNLVDDRSESVMSYYEFLVHLQKQISK